jgi:hypothetical protein
VDAASGDVPKVAPSQPTPSLTGPQLPPSRQEIEGLGEGPVKVRGHLAARVHLGTEQPKLLTRLRPESDGATDSRASQLLAVRDDNSLALSRMPPGDGSTHPRTTRRTRGTA